MNAFRVIVFSLSQIFTFVKGKLDFFAKKKSCIPTTALHFHNHYTIIMFYCQVKRTLARQTYTRLPH